jgi:hypothetical protein
MRHLRILALGVFALVIAGCAGAVHSAPESALRTSVTAPPQPAGAWQLIRVDGHEIPHSPVQRDRPADAPAAPRIEILSASLVLASDGSFSQKMAYRMERDGVMHAFERDFTGSWTPQDGGYVLTWEGAGRTPARLEGDEFTYDNAGMLLTFRRVR